MSEHAVGNILAAQKGGIYFTYLDKLSESPPETKCITCNLLVIRYLERIADHATYAGEAIVYIATGQKVILG